VGLEQKIGFDKVRVLVTNRCQTEYAAERVAQEEYSTRGAEIMARLRLVDEMRTICLFEDSFPVSGYVDTRAFLAPLSSTNSCIDLPSLGKLRIAMETLRQLVSFFADSKDDLYPNLREMTSAVAYFPEVGRRIGAILDKNNNIKDSASAELQQIRSSLRDKEGSIAKKITAILHSAQAEGIVDEDVTVSVRDGRTLIPVSAANKRKIQGFVYDESASGKTVFVEPLEIVALENQIRELQFEEQREIQKILFEFTDFIRPYLPELLSAGDYMGEIDFIHAKGMVAVDMIAGMPILSDNGELQLRKARHPLLEASLIREHKQIVPLTLFLTPEKHLLLISGPNAGGKSVCLKTVGLLQYMFQWGLLVPTSEISEFPVFQKFFIDIGDDQSLENDLSTYSSHLSKLRDILENADEHSLVLIDEFGGGTEPAAGGAIAEAVLAELDRRGCYGVITTHYTNLKLYASSSSGVINGAMQFDAQAIRPMFILEMGLPGNSFAFELARKMGLPETVVHDAEERAGAEYVNIERNLRKIARNRKALDEKLAHIKATDKTLDGLTDKYQKELSEVKELKKQILDEARQQAREIVSEANRQVERTIRDIREAQADKEKTKLIRKEMTDFKESLETSVKTANDLKIEAEMERIIARKEREKQRKIKRGEIEAAAAASIRDARPQDEENRPLMPGDKVRLKDNPDMVGEITRISGKYVYVTVGSISSRLQYDKVERISSNAFSEAARREKSARRSTFSVTGGDGGEASSLSQRRLNFSPSIDLRGDRLMEAMERVVPFVDDAIMLGMGQVKILHGKGTGALREEIRKYLKTVPGVASFHDEDIRFGGTGITVVELD